jgi:octaprenyl-diphosphate synthase
MARDRSAELPEVLDPVRDDVRRVGERYDAILAGVSERTQAVVGQASRFGGKRLRPALTCLAARVAGSSATEEVATVAAIVELIHTATLVHDDVLDGAVVRRRVATLNARWGDGIAVLGGDVLFSRAYHAASCLADRFASRYLSAVVGEVLEGEIHQDLVSRNASLPEEEYRLIVRGKTAALYEAALVVGAHYGGAPKPVEEALGRFGHHFGMAFQIVDDRLDLTGDEATVGKSLGRDLGEGKTTLPVILWLRGRPARERDEARALVEAAWDDPARAHDLARRLASDGALAAADAAAQEEVDAALEALAGLPEGVELDVLRTIAGFVRSRRL